jgi:AcrR family transcriptional regulator
MGIVERRSRQKQEIRQRILTTAWEQVVRDGWQSLSIRKIAEAIEYSVPVIYDHFENKDEILLELSKQGFELLSKKLKQAGSRHPGPADQLQAMADAYWHFAFKNRAYYQVMFGIGMPCCERQRSVTEKGGMRDLFMGPIDQLLKEKDKRQADPCLKYHAFWSVLHGLVSIKMMGNYEVSDKLNKLVLEDAVTGFIKNLEG